MQKDREVRVGTFYQLLPHVLANWMDVLVREPIVSLRMLAPYPIKVYTFGVKTS